MMKYKLKVENPSVDGITGHHTIDVCIVEIGDEGQEIKGISEQYAIDALALESRHSGDVNQWLQWVGQEMLDKHIKRSKVHTELLLMHGTTIELEEKS